MTLNLQRVKRIGGPGSNDLAAYLAVLSAWANGATLTEGDVALLAGFITSVDALQTKHNALVDATDALQTQHNLLATAVAELQTQYNLLATAVDEAALASVSDVAATESDEDIAATESDEDFAAIAAAVALTPPTTIDG